MPVMGAVVAPIMFPSLNAELRLALLPVAANRLLLEPVKPIGLEGRAPIMCES